MTIDFESFLRESLIASQDDICGRIKFSCKNWRFPGLIIGFISDTDRRIGDPERFHLGEALTALNYFRLFTSAPRGQGKQLNCAKLSLNLYCSNLYRDNEYLASAQIAILFAAI